MPMLTDIFRRGSPTTLRPRIPLIGTQTPNPGSAGDTLTGVFGGINPPSTSPAISATPGKTDWWSLMMPLIATGLGAAFGGKRGALVGGVAALQGMAAERQTRAAVEKAQRKEEKLDREEQRQIQKEEKEEQRRIQKEEKEEERRKAAQRQQASTSYALRKVQTPDLHPDDKTAIDKAETEEIERKRKKKEEEEAREHQKELAREDRAEKREKARESRSEGQKKKEKESDKTEKEELPPKPTDIKFALESLKNEKEEIEKAGVSPKDAQGKTIAGEKKTFTPQQQARLTEIDTQVARLRAAQAQSVLGRIGRSNKKTATGVEIERPPTGADFEAAARRAVNERRVNPTTGQPFKDVAEAQAYLFAEWQKRQGKL